MKSLVGTSRTLGALVSAFATHVLEQNSPGALEIYSRYLFKYHGGILAVHANSSLSIEIRDGTDDPIIEDSIGERVQKRTGSAAGNQNRSAGSFSGRFC
jgi:hypothetical protein